MMRYTLALAFGLLGLIGGQAANAADTSPNRIIFLGDSITQAGAGPGGYVTLVRELIQKHHPDGKMEIIGAGISGNRVPDLQQRLERDVLSKKPNLVVIYIGINDVWHSQNGKGTSKNDYRAGLLQIIEQIQKADSQVVLCTPSVIGEKTDGSNALDGMLDEYCEISRQVAKQTSSHLLDLRKAFLSHLKVRNPENAPQGVLTTDGVHLNAAGNQFIARQMLKALMTTTGAHPLLRHVVLMKFKEDLTDQQVQEVIDAFAALPNQIDEIADFEFGTDVSVENKAQGFTHCFLVSFYSVEDRDAYLPHPAHGKFVELVGPRVENVLVFDYFSKANREEK